MNQEVKGDDRGPWGHPILFLSRGKTKKIIFCKNSRLQNRFDFWNTPPLEFLCKFLSTSTNLSPMTNSESKRYQYPVCPAKAGPPSIPYPDSKVQREALYCPSRGLCRASTFVLGLFSSKMIKVFILPLDRPDQKPPFSSLRSKRSEAFSRIASPSSSAESLSLSPDLEASSYNSAENFDSSSRQSGPPDTAHTEDRPYPSGRSPESPYLNPFHFDPH